METKLVVPEIAPTGLTLVSGPPIAGTRMIAEYATTAATLHLSHLKGC